MRLQENCDFVIAVTHMRYTEDITILDEPQEDIEKVDLILGGHDHDVFVYPPMHKSSDDSTIGNDNIKRPYIENEYPGSLKLVKSGTDWRSLSILDLHIEREPATQRVGKMVKQHCRFSHSPVSCLMTDINSISNS